jgi:hypothetical protein
VKVDRTYVFDGPQANHLVGLVPNGRDEAGLSYTMEWLERHAKTRLGRDRDGALEARRGVATFARPLGRRPGPTARADRRPGP